MHNIGHPPSLMTAALADIDAVKAAATARTEEKRIVYEDVMWGETDLARTVCRKAVACYMCRTIFFMAHVMWQDESSILLKSLFEHRIYNSGRFLLEAWSVST